MALRAVVEKYPELIAQESFARLQRELVETEQRIALARTYYNDIATQFATRLEQVPDRWVARLGAMRPEALLQAEGFERAADQGVCQAGRFALRRKMRVCSVL